MNFFKARVLSKGQRHLVKAKKRGGNNDIRKWRMSGKNKALNVSERYTAIINSLKAAKIPGGCIRKGLVGR